MDFSTLDALFHFVRKSNVMRETSEFIVDTFFKLIADDLAILKVIVIAPPQQLVEDGVLQVLQSIATSAESIISSFDLKDMSEEMAFELETQLFVLLMPVRDWTKVAEKTYEERPKPSRFYHPKTSPLLFVDRLVENLEDLMKMKAELLGPLGHFVSLFRHKLQYLSTERRSEVYLMESVTHLSYEAEYAIDSFLVKDVPLWYSVHCLLHIQREFALLERESTIDTSEDDDIVGFKVEMKRMLHELTRGSETFSVVSVVGMAGQGKTTLATKMYNDGPIVKHFDLRAKCIISQTYEKRDLLLQLLADTVQITKEVQQMPEYDLGVMLKKSLSGQRFLIYMDDIWKIDAWKELSEYIPKTNNGSRVMFTTRSTDLASEVKSECILQAVNPLSDDEGLELLKRRVFQKNKFPRELLDFGKQIAKICKGLPLSLVLAAGILKKLERRDDEWKQIAEKFSSQSVVDAGATGIVELSYKQLQDNIKPCFLYFGAFLEDKDVAVQKLQKYWSAEGFIGRKDGKSVEEVAEGYVEDLVSRSLVIVGKKRSDGGVQACHVHDLLRDFCLSKSTEENFLQLVRGYDEFFPSSNDSPSSEPIVYYLRRLCIYSKSNHFLELKPSGPLVRTLLFTGINDTSPAKATLDQKKIVDKSDISFISNSFKLLRILDLEDINIGEHFEAFNVLVRLRYLAVQGFFNSIPAIVGKLKHLETLNVKGLGGEAVKVPDCIWDMAKLRHIHVNDSASFDIDPHRLEESATMPINLQTFSTPSLTYGDDMEILLRKLKGIRKLKCIFLDSWDDDDECNKFPLLEFLDKLVKVKVIYSGEVKYPCKFSFPSNLKKLTLSNFRMPWDQIAQLANTCENLKILKLLNNAFDGETWEMEEDVVFEKLKVLKLDNLNFETWNATNENFPELEHLQLANCPNLEEIPCDFKDIAPLELIKVVWCKRSAAISAKKIELDIYEYNDKFKLDIVPKLLDHEWSPDE